MKQSIQSLRGIAFVLVFLCHANINAPRNYGAIGVMIFFMMSGYLLRMKHRNEVFDISLKKNTKSALGRIKRLYPLHLMTLVGALPLVIGKNIVFNDITKESILIIFVRLLLSTLLLDQWVIGIQAINVVEWYLSVALFVYIGFPYINNVSKELKKPFLMLVFSVFIRSVYIYLFDFVERDSIIYSYFTYYFPLLRCLDTFIGMLICDTIMSYKAVNTNNKKSFLFGMANMGIVVFVAIIYILWLINGKVQLEIDSFYISIVELLMAVLVVVIFSSGIWILPIFNNYFIKRIGDLSAYAFLIHYMLFMWIDAVKIVLRIDCGIVISVIIAIFVFVITIIFSLGYEKWINKRIDNARIRTL